MTTTTTAALTPKQRQVYELLGAGTPPAEIARHLKISPSGVYGHMRNIRAAGVDLPGDDGQPPPAPPQPQAASNGSAASDDPRAALTAAIDRTQAQREATDVEVQRAEQRIGELTAQRTALDERIERYNAALGALS
jgi:Bacterial regulatory proteins, luxR family